MKKIHLLLFSFAIILTLITSSYAVSFTFYGTDADGVGSAVMDITISGNTLNLTLDNTSPTQLIDNSGPNTPGITKFGFDFVNFNSISLLSWELKAYELDGQNLSNSTVVIGGSPISGYNKWKMNVGETVNGVSLDYVPSVYQGIDGALFNPLALLGDNNLPDGINIPFFTTAYLTMNFSGSPILDEFSTYVRMQNVGRNGEGSLKIHGVIPEPGTMALLGSLASGMFGFAGLKRKLIKK